MKIEDIGKQAAKTSKYKSYINPKIYSKNQEIMTEEERLKMELKHGNECITILYGLLTKSQRNKYHKCLKELKPTK